MARYTPTDIADAQQRYKDAIARVQKAAVSATPQQAKNIVGDGQKYPWLSPRVNVLLNQAGASDAARKIAAFTAARQGMAEGAFDDEPIAPVTAAETKPKKKGFFDKLKSAASFGVRNTFGLDLADAGVKATTRVAATAMAAPYEMVQGHLGQTIDSAMGQIRAIRDGDLGEFKRQYTRQVGVATGTGTANPNAGVLGTVQQTAAYQYATNPGKGGSGYFAGKGITDLAAAKARQVRGVDKTGAAWTLGRFVGQAIPENSKWHSRVSGTIDVAANITLDPINIATAGLGKVEGVGKLGRALQGPVAGTIMEGRRIRAAERLAEAGILTERAREAQTAATGWRQIAEEAGSVGAATQAQEASFNAARWAAEMDDLVGRAEALGGIADAAKKANPEWVEQVRAGAGLVDSPKGQTAVRVAHFKWMLGHEGQKTIAGLAAVTDPTVVHAMYGGKIPVKSAVEIADATTPDEVVRALGRALTIDGDTALRSPATIATAKGIERRVTIGDRFPTLARAMGYVPDGTWLDFHDPEDAVRKVFDTLGNAKITGKERSELVGEWMRALADQDTGALYEVGKRTNARLGKQLVDAGMDQADADAITTAFFRDSERIKAYTTEDITSLVPGTFMDGRNSPLRVTQVLDRGWGLMDQGELARVRIQTGRVKALLGEEGSRRRIPKVAVDWYQNHLFKPIAVLRPALMARILPDEALRVTMGGHVGDAGGVLMAIWNHPKASAMGDWFDAPGKLRDVQKRIAKAEKAANAIGSEVTKLVKTGDEAALLAKYPDRAEALGPLFAEKRELAAMLDDIEAGNSLNRWSGRLRELIEEKSPSAGDNVADALRESLDNMDGRIVRAIHDDPDLADLYAEHLNLEKMMERPGGRIVEGLTGTRGNATAAARFEGGRVDDTAMYRSGSWIIVNRDDSRYKPMFEAGLVDELMSQAADPVYRRIANGGLLPDDFVHADPTAVDGLATEYMVRRKELHDELMAIDDEADRLADARAARQAELDAGLEPLVSRRDQIAEAREAGRKRVAERQKVVDRLQAEVDELVDGDAQEGAIRAARRELREATKDLEWTRRIEAGSLPEMAPNLRAETADVNRQIRAARKGHKEALREFDALEAQLANRRKLAERRGSKIEAAFEKGLLDVPGKTHLPGDASTLDDVKAWLTHGEGRKYAQRYFRSIELDPDPESISQWVDLMAKDVETTWGGNLEIRQAIASGKLRGQALREPTRQWGPKAFPSDVAREWAKEFAASAEAPARVRYEPSLEEARRHGLSFAERASKERRRVLDTAFAAFYGNQSDRFIRIPEYATGYWSNMEQLIPALDREEALSILDNLAAADLPKAQEQRIRTLINGASGDGLLEDADRLAHGYALDDVKALLFDMDRKNQFQDMVGTIAPFGRAWWEVLSTWGKIGAENRTILPNKVGQAYQAATMVHKADKTIGALRDNGWFYTDENGEEVFNYPLSGAAARLFANRFAPGSEATVQSMFRGRVAGLSMAGQILPGLGPVVSVPTYELAQHMPVPDRLIDAVFPFGEPEGLGGAITAPWMEKLKSAYNADESESMFANTFAEAVRNLASSGQYDLTYAGQEKLIADARKQATGLMVLRGLSQAFVPSAPIPTYLADTDQGMDVAVMKLSQEYGKLMTRFNDDRAKAQEETGARSADEAFIDQFGPGAIYYVVGKTKTATGGETLSEQFGRWEQSNQDIVKSYPNIYGWFGPQVDGFSLSVYQRQIDAGSRERRTPNEMLALGNAKLADIEYYTMRDRILAQNREQGVNTMSAEQRQWFAQYRDELEAKYPGWDIVARSSESKAMQEKRIDQLKAAVRDPRIRATPTGKSLVGYMKDRAAAIDEATKAGIIGWGSADRTAPLRDWLRQRALEYGAQDPGFMALYDDVLSREMED